MLNEELIKTITEELTKNDVLNLVKKDKDFEKRVKSIVSDVVIDMFRVLWQHSNMFKALGK
jgi:hypothetical protein